MIKVVLYLYRTGPSVSWTMRRVSRPLRLMGRRSLARRSFWQQRPARSSRGSRQIPYSLGLGPCDGLSDGRMCSASACSSASWARRVGRVRLGGSRSPKRRKNGKLQSKYGDFSYKLNTSRCREVQTTASEEDHHRRRGRWAALAPALLWLPVSRALVQRGHAPWREIARCFSPCFSPTIRPTLRTAGDGTCNWPLRSRWFGLHLLLP